MMETRNGTITTAGPLMRAFLWAVGKTGFAAPWGTAYIHPQDASDRELIAHEDCHLEQLQDMGALEYTFTHLKNNATVGYQENPLEIEARAYAQKYWRAYRGLE